MAQRPTVTQKSRKFESHAITSRTFAYMTMTMTMSMTLLTPVSFAQ